MFSLDQKKSTEMFLALEKAVNMYEPYSDSAASEGSRPRKTWSWESKSKEIPLKHKVMHNVDESQIPLQGEPSSDRVRPVDHDGKPQGSLKVFSKDATATTGI